MKTLEKLYTDVMGSDELKSAVFAAAKENKLGEFLKAQGCEATEAEVAEFLKSKQGAEGEMADDELDAVAGGGCNAAETTMSCMTLGLGCVAGAIVSATKDMPEDGWGADCLLCEPL